MVRGAPVPSFGSNKAAQQLRQFGYADAKAGRKPQRDEPAYMVGYRGGKKALADAQKRVIDS